MTNKIEQMRHRKKILTWHIHGSYLYYLTRAPYDFILPVKPDRRDGYGGRGGTFDWGPHVFEVPAEEIKNQKIDCVIFQSRKNYLEDQYEILSPDQLELPKIYLEHDPPREHPTDTRHIVDDPEILLIHVTHFNRLMWDSGQTPTRVIDHGVVTPEGALYSGELERGIVIVNNLLSRGRRLGADLFAQAKTQVPLDLVGMNSIEAGGIGEMGLNELHFFETKYRFFFNPIRYTSLGLAVCEAMMLGMPILGMATTEMVTAVENGYNGYVDTNLERVVEYMNELLHDWDKAKSLGRNARAYAEERFNIQRFTRDWQEAIELVTEGSPAKEPG